VARGDLSTFDPRPGTAAVRTGDILVAAVGVVLYVTATFFRMRLAGLSQMILATLAVWLFAGTGTASAQFFGPKRPKTPITKLIGRQAPPKVNSGLAGTINPGNSRVIVSLSKQRAYVMVGDEVYIDTPISSGKRAGMTPTGQFTVMEKDANHRSSIYGDFVDGRGRTVRSGVSTRVDSAPSGTRYVGAPMKWFCRLTNSGVGMHTGILPGYPASHGCIRLPAEIAPLIYEMVKVGTPVTIEG
jgi:lipoprotein-anchoring transpeptidase ErfK/SrfK